MFSAVFLPLMVIPLLLAELKSRDLRVISLALTVPNYDQKDSLFNYIYVDDALKTHEIVKHYSLPDSPIVFDSLRQNLERLKSKNYRPNKQIGISVHLQSNSTYSDLIHLLNLCLITKTKRYGLDFRTNTFYYFREIEEKSIESMFCGDVIYDVIDDRTKFEKLIDSLNLRFLLRLDSLSILILVSYVFFVIMVLRK